MATLVHQLKCEPLDLSDSDSDKLLIEESTCDTVDDERWVRRSSRTRRSSTRFYDFFTGNEEPTTFRAAPKNSKNRVDSVKKSTSGSSRKVEPPPTNENSKDVKILRAPLEDRKNAEPAIGVGEPFDPEILVSYVEKTKTMILPGQCSVKVPTGPGGQFVNLDGVEYLRGLGYYEYIDSLIEEEDVIGEDDGIEEITEMKPAVNTYERLAKTEPSQTEKDLLRKRVEFETQRAMMTNSVANSGNRGFKGHIVKSQNPVYTGQETTLANPVYRIKEVDEPDQFSSASAYSSDEDRDDSNGDNDEIDVTGGSPPRPSLPTHIPALEQPFPEAPSFEILSDSSSPESSTNSSSKPRKARFTSFPDDGRRSQHNEMEKLRRMQMADLFNYLKRCIAYPQLQLELTNKVNLPKVKILSESVQTIDDLTKSIRMYEKLKLHFNAENKRLRARYNELEGMLKGMKHKQLPERQISKQTAKAKRLDQKATVARVLPAQTAKAGGSQTAKAKALTWGVAVPTAKKSKLTLSSDNV